MTWAHRTFNCSGFTNCDISLYRGRTVALLIRVCASGAPCSPGCLWKVDADEMLITQWHEAVRVKSSKAFLGAAQPQSAGLDLFRSDSLHLPKANVTAGTAPLPARTTCYTTPLRARVRVCVCTCSCVCLRVCWGGYAVCICFCKHCKMRLLLWCPWCCRF